MVVDPGGMWSAICVQKSDSRSEQQQATCSLPLLSGPSHNADKVITAIAKQKEHEALTNLNRLVNISSMYGDKNFPIAEFELVPFVFHVKSGNIVHSSIEENIHQFPWKNRKTPPHRALKHILVHLLTRLFQKL